MRVNVDDLPFQLKMKTKLTLNMRAKAAAEFKSISATALRPRMRRIISLLQPLRRDMRVNLRRDEMRVAEQFLHAPQIRASVQQMRRVTVTQLVRRQTR